MALPFKAWARCNNLGSVASEGKKLNQALQHSAVGQMLLAHAHLTVLLSRRVPQVFSSVWQEANEFPSTVTPVYAR